MSVRLTQVDSHYELDVPVGEVVEIAIGDDVMRVTPKVVREDLQYCGECVLNAVMDCADLACTASTRKDDEDVIFVEAKQNELLTK